MTCDEIAPLIARGADGILDGDQQQVVARHLETCSACREMLEEQQLVARMLSQRPDVDPPVGLVGRVITSVDASPTWFDVVNWRVWTFRLAPVAVALLVIASLNLGPSTQVEPAELLDLATGWLGDDTAEELPAFSLFWQEDATDDALLDAVLTAEPDERVTGS